MDDLISRQAAIDALGERPIVWDDWTDEYELGQRNQYDSDKLAIETVPSAQPTQTNTFKALEALDCVSRQEAIAVADSSDYVGLSVEDVKKVTDEVIRGLKQLPSAQPTLYGYKIEHLAYIARVMEKEGVTADYAVRTFDDISRALRMIIEEAQERVVEALNERYDLQTGGD